MKWLKEEFRGVIERIVFAGFKSGEKLFIIEYFDGTENEVFERDLNKYFEEK